MEDTIAAIATAQGVGAISIIRVSGPMAISIVSCIFSNKNFFDAPSHTIHYGKIYDDEVIDEVLVSLMRAPKTYTREDVVEINAHGGISTTNKILELLLVKGCRLAEPGEFSKRAFLNGRIDLTEAEGIMDLINAKTDVSRKMAINQVGGKVSSLIMDLRNELASIISNIEVNIDYPEYEDTPLVTNEMIRSGLSDLFLKVNNILSESKNGEILKDGINTVIIGKPNVGKSSLLNRLLGTEKAIVTDIRGTTRDSIEARCVLGNIVLNLIDTAGIRDTSDVVEKIGVNKSIELIDKASLILFVLNYNEKLDEEDKKILSYLGDKNYISIINKIDLPKVIDDSGLKNKVYVSALNDDNISGVRDKILELFNLSEIETADLTYLTSARSEAILRNVLSLISSVENGLNSNMPIDMIEIDLKSIWNLLGEIIGQTYTDELLDEIFSRFCVGK